MTVPEPSPREDPQLDRWVGTGDLDELLREVDRRCERQDWEGVVIVRDRARTASERGHQLWPAASFAEYRIALDAPAEWAAGVVDGGYLAPGPLSEVVAQRHRFVDLATHLAPGPARSQVAQERVLRGELVEDGAAGELPGRLLGWEPAYEVAEYLPNGDARFPAPPPVPALEPVDGRPLGPAPDATDGARALADAVRHWRTASEGLVTSVGVEGSGADAVTTLVSSASGDDGPDPTDARRSEVDRATAVALLAWAAASGGAQGRRRGAATGRFEAWWVLASLVATEDEWPVDPGPSSEELRWWVWEPDGPVGSFSPGWVCRIAVEDPVDGLAWALDATDRIPDVDAHHT